MKSLLLGIEQLLTAICMVILATIVFPTLSVLGIMYSFIKHIILLDYSFSKQLVPVFQTIYRSLDGFACATAGELLNDTLEIKGRIKYGSWSDTISAITGLIRIYEKDTWLRRFLTILGKNHCEDAITKEEKYYWKNLNNL